MEVDPSADGEFTKSPPKHSPMPLSKDMVGSYGLSDNDAEDNAGSLDIKPPQATVHHHHKSSRSSSGRKREKHLESSSRQHEHIHGSKNASCRKGHHRSRKHREHHEEQRREKLHYRKHHEHGKVVVEHGTRVLGDLREHLNRRRSENERRMKMERQEWEHHVKEEPVQTLPSPSRETPHEQLEKNMQREKLLEAGNTKESTSWNIDAKEPYNKNGSPAPAVEHSYPTGSEISQNKNKGSELEFPENKTNQVDENGISFINEESPKSDLVLQDSLPPYFPAIQGCRSVEEFQCLNRIEEGAYGVVYRARDKRTNEVVALKRLKMEKEKEGFPITSLREISTLLKVQHPNIVTVHEIVVASNMDKIFIVMDYVEHDLKSLMETMKQKKQCFIPGEVKCLMLQLLRAVAHLHDNWILHRDLKTSNLLLSHKGILKVGDLGLAREYGSPLKGYTPTVVTLWYRAPEILLCTKEYSTAIDIWSVGCIFGEFLSMEVLFPGESEVDQLDHIFKYLGTPNERIWPGYSKLPAVQKTTFAEYPVNQLRQRFGTMITEVGMNLMNRFLTYDPTQRISAEDALCHAYFSEAPLPIDPAVFPTWPAKSELGHQRATAASPKPPPGGHEYKQLGDNEVPAGRFHMDVTEKGHTAVGAGFSLKF